MIFGRISAFIFQGSFSKKRQTTTPRSKKIHQIHKPQPRNPAVHYSKILARRNARKRSAAPVLDGEQCVLNEHCSSCQTLSSKFLELFAQFQVLQALGSSSNPPKVPPAAPRIPPGLPKRVPDFPFAAQVSPFSDFWLIFWRPQNSSKFDIVQKPPKTSKMEAQDASKLDFKAFWKPFWETFSAMFRYFYEKGEKRANTVIPQ